MVNLIGEKVKHKTLGVGTVTTIDGNHFTIEFPTRAAKFTYPMAFESFLVPVDGKIAESIKEELEVAIKEETRKKTEEEARRIAAEEQRRESLQDKEKKKSVRKTGSVKIESEIKRALGQSLTYLVFQGEAYDEQYKGQFIWMPKYTKTGGRCRQWERLKEVRQGDIIFHCSNGYIRAISVAKNHCFDSVYPNQMTEDMNQSEKEGRRVDCEYYVLDVPVKYGNYKDIILKDFNAKSTPFDKEEKENIGYLFDFERRLALYFLEVVADDNEFLYDVDVFYSMLVGVPTITNMEELLDNCRVLDDYISSRKDPEYSYALNLIKRGTCFVAIENNGGYKFYPSRFVGYKDNSMLKHENNEWKDGKQTNPAIGSILGVGVPIPSTSLEVKYKEYCRKLGFEPQEKGAFGAEHKYWVIQ